MLRLLSRHVHGRGHLISVGGIDSAREVYARLKAGATLVQLYTALIYEGPLLINRILRGLVELMDKDGIGSVEEVIGMERE